MGYHILLLHAVALAGEANEAAVLWKHAEELGGVEEESVAAARRMLAVASRKEIKECMC